MRTLHAAPGLSVPPDAVTQTIGLLRFGGRA